MLCLNCYGVLLSDENRYNCLPGICIYCCIVFLDVKKGNLGIKAVVALSAVCRTCIHSKIADIFQNCGFVNKADNSFWL